MEYLLLQVKSDSTIIAEGMSNHNSISIWFWIAVLEFFIIILLIFKIIRRRKNLTFYNISKDKMTFCNQEKIDMENIIDSITDSRKLYKELVIMCHPDKFLDATQKDIAEELFKEINKYQRNFKKLTEIKHIALEKLDIRF